MVANVKKRTEKGKIDILYAVSTAVKDKEVVDDFLDRMKTQFKLSTAAIYNQWHMNQILPHNEETFKKQILDKFESSNFILACISPEFFASDFIKNHEIPLLKRNKNRKLGILVGIKRINFSRQNQNYQGFEDYQIFTYNGKFYAECDELERDAFAYELFTAIEKVLTQRAGAKSA